MKIKCLFLAVIATAVLCSSGNLLAYSGGTGDPCTPYQIANVADWQALTRDSGNWGKFFVMTANIDLLKQSITPVGNSSAKFTGVFEGNNYAISNLAITTSTDYAGLFGYVGPGAQIKNLNVTNVILSGANWVGGLAGYSSGIITNCSSTGSVTGSGQHVAGLVGHNPGIIRDSHSTASASGSAFVGGLTGQNEQVVTGCYATGSATATEYYSFAGGLAGVNNATTTKSYATGSVSGVRFVGGLVGGQNGTITECYATGSVLGDTWVGGLLGQDHNGVVTNCYATGLVNGNAVVGGLIGWEYGTVTNCYATGVVVGGSNFGGVFGQVDSGVQTACFWDTTTSRTINGVGNIDPDPAQVIGMPTNLMQTASTFTSKGWDFDTEWIISGVNYPRLMSLSKLYTLTMITTSPGFVTSVSPSVGTHSVTGLVTISATTFVQCPAIYTFDHWEGTGIADPTSASTTVSMTSDKTVNAVFSLATAVCGDTCHSRSLPMDFNQDCQIDWQDMCLFCSHWLEFTDSTACGNGHTPYSMYDINQDCYVDFQDFALMASAWATTNENDYSETLNTELGALTKAYPVRTVSGKGATLSSEFTIVPDGKPVLLEIQEIHNRRPDVFGYMVIVNGHEVYFRTYYEMASGPNHYFVQIAPEIAGLSTTLRVMLRNESNGEFSIGNMWVYSNFFDGIAQQEQVFRTMPILFDPRSQGSDDWGSSIWGDYTSILPKVTDYQARYADTTCYGPPGLCWTWGFAYGFHPLSGVRQSIDLWLNLSSATGMRMQFDLNGLWWGTNPQGPDGIGGYFSDLKYQQICYKADDKTYHTTFGGSFWGPTFNNEQLLEARKARFKSIMQYTVNRIAFLKAHGKAVPPPIIVRCHGEDYWIGGDFGDAIRAAAQQDGVTLNPEDGLTGAELDWMDRNLVRYLSAISANSADAVGRDAVLIDRGTTNLPEQQLFSDLFLEGGSGAYYPHYDEERRSSFWRSFSADMWPSNEPGWSYVTEERCRDDYVKANGKLGCVNQEWCVLTDLAFLKNHYQMGYQFETIYGGAPYYRDWLRAVDNIDANLSLAPVHVERRLLDVNTKRDKNMGPTSQIVAMNNLTLPYMKDDAVYARMSVANKTQTGSITYRLDSKDGTFTNDLMLEMGAVIQSATGIAIYGGPQQSAMQLLATLTGNDLVVRQQWSSWGTRVGHVDLGAAMARLGMPPSAEFYLKIVLPSGNSEVWINTLKVTRRWPWQSGHLAGNPFTVKQARITQLWVQDRAVTERMMEKYRSLGGTDATYAQAEQLFTACRYRSAYRLLAGEISQLLPARYAVRGHGQLGRYPIVVTMNNDNCVALVNVMKSDANGAEFMLKTETPQVCHVAFGNLLKDQHYELQQQGVNHYRLQPASQNAPYTADGNGVVEMNLPIYTANDPLPLPQSFSAIFLEGGIPQFTVWLQDPCVSLLDERTTMTAASNITYSRQQEGSQVAPSNDWPQAMDMVNLTLDASGKVTKITALYGRDSGKIKAFYPPVIRGGSLSNGVIELENGNKYELGYNGYFTTLNMSTLKSPFYDPDYLAARILPGTYVEVSYCPYTYNNQRLKRATMIYQP